MSLGTTVISSSAPLPSPQAQLPDKLQGGPFLLHHPLLKSKNKTKAKPKEISQLLVWPHLSFVFYQEIRLSFWASFLNSLHYVVITRFSLRLWTSHNIPLPFSIHSSQSQGPETLGRWPLKDLDKGFEGLKRFLNFAPLFWALHCHGYN